MDSLAARRIGSICFGLHLRRAARRASRRYDAALAPAQLTIGQFSLLAMLGAQERWAIAPLANVLGTDRTSLTANLKPLERRGLVASVGDAGDRRLRYLALTSAGAAALEHAEPLWRAAQDAIAAELGSGDAAGLRDTLNKID